MISNDCPNDPSLAALASLKTYDVNAAPAERLRVAAIDRLTANT